MSATLATRIKAWRAKRHIPATEAARLLGMSVRTLNGIEQGRPFPHERLLELAMQAVDMEGAAHGNAS